MTGFGGTTQRADEVKSVTVKPVRTNYINKYNNVWINYCLSQQVDGGKVIRIDFTCNVHSAMPWKFRPTQNSIKVTVSTALPPPFLRIHTSPHLPYPTVYRPRPRPVCCNQLVPGETALAFYTVTNTSDKTITGVATYNVYPPKAGQSVRWRGGMSEAPDLSLPVNTHTLTLHSLVDSSLYLQVYTSTRSSASVSRSSACCRARRWTCPCSSSSTQTSSRTPPWRAPALSHSHTRSSRRARRRWSWSRQRTSPPPPLSLSLLQLPLSPGRPARRQGQPQPPSPKYEGEIDGHHCMQLDAPRPRSLDRTRNTIARKHWLIVAPIGTAYRP